MIKVFLFVFNRPDILNLQIKSLQKFIKNKVEIIVIQDKHDNSYDKKFSDICEHTEVSLYSHISNKNNSPSMYHANSIQYAYDNFLNDEDLVLFLDHDMFAIDYIDLVEYLNGHDAAGLYQHRGEVKYVWPGILLFDYNAIKGIKFNFLPQVYNNQTLDTGGGTYRLFEANLKIKNTNVEYPKSYKDYSLDSYQYPFELHMNQKFLHSRNGCQWNNSYNVTDFDKTNIIKKILGGICE